MQILLSLTLSGSAMALVLSALRYILLKRMPSTSGNAVEELNAILENLEE